MDASFRLLQDRVSRTAWRLAWSIATTCGCGRSATSGSAGSHVPPDLPLLIGGTQINPASSIPTTTATSTGAAPLTEYCGQERPIWDR